MSWTASEPSPEKNPVHPVHPCESKIYSCLTLNRFPANRRKGFVSGVQPDESARGDPKFHGVLTFHLFEQGEEGKALTISAKEEDLFKEWRKSRTPFVCDGAVSEQDYLKSCPQIAFILKETNDPGDDFDLRQFLQNQNGGKGTTWNNVARWVHGIRNLPSECDWSCYENVDARFRREVLRGIVAMNLKKSPGGGRTVFRVLKNVAREDALHIQNQYSLYDPDITICGGVETTGGLFHDLVHPGIEWKQTTRGIWWYRRNAQKYVVAFHHPAARVRGSRMLGDLMTAIKEIKQEQE